MSSAYQRTVNAAHDLSHPLNVNSRGGGDDVDNDDKCIADCINSKQDSKSDKVRDKQQANISIVNECATAISTATSNNNADTCKNDENICSTLINACRYCPLMPRSVSPASQLNEYESLSLQRVYDELQQRHHVLRVCLTGGPCAGKSTLLAEIQSRIPDRTGFQVLCVP